MITLEQLRAKHGPMADLYNSPDACNPDWPKEGGPRDFWIGVTDPEQLADLMDQECQTPEDLDRFMELPGVTLASDAEALREAAEVLRERRGW